MWPCGDFEKHFEVLPINWPKSHWAWYTDSSRAVSGRTPGKTLKRVCMGVIICTSPTCNFHLRPHVFEKGKRIPKQHEQKCENPCRFELQWLECNAKCFW